MDNGPLIVDKSEVEKEELPIWCEGCDQQGLIFVEDTKKPAFVVCGRCGFEASQLWCPKCGMGGDFIRNIEDRPIYWVCESCMTRYMLPNDFYEKPLPLYVGGDRPVGIRIKTFPVQRQPFIKLTNKSFPGLIFLFIMIVSMGVMILARDWKLQMYGLLFFLVTLVAASAYQNFMRNK